MSQILGALFAILIGISSIPAYLAYQNQSSQNIRAATTAQQAVQFNTAATSYIEQNSTAIQSVATAATPAIITVAMLQATNNLSASFNATNPFGQTWVLEVLQPSPGNLQAFAMTTGGTALQDKVASQIASMVGQPGGFFPKNDSGIYAGGSANAYGAFSGWGPVSTANYTNISGGELASLLTFNNGQLVDNRLYRVSIPGQPQLNTMSTPLIMAATQTAGSACSTTGSIAQDGTGAVISCSSITGTWQYQGSLYWQSPVANYASLPACSAASAWQTRIVETPTVGSGPRAYACDGTAWKPLGADDNGNLILAGNFSAKTVTSTLIVNAGDSCAGYPTGAQAQDASGSPLYCQSAAWAKQASSGGTNLPAKMGAPTYFTNYVLCGTMVMRFQTGSSSGEVNYSNDGQTVNVSYNNNGSYRGGTAGCGPNSIQTKATLGEAFN